MRLLFYFSQLKKFIIAFLIKFINDFIMILNGVPSELSISPVAVIHQLNISEKCKQITKTTF